MEKPIITSRTVLFLGAGFSRECKNLDGKKFPLGSDIKSYLLKFAPDATEHDDLKDIASTARSNPDSNIAYYISRSFRVMDIDSNALSILSHRWKRVYTTNYDNVIEECQHKAGTYADSLSDTAALPRKLLPNSVIHLHGSVYDVHDDNTNTSNDAALENIILDNKSYLQMKFASSRMRSQFLKDVQYAQNIIFCGYALNDQHITELLSPIIINKEKVSFFVHDDTSVLQERKLSEYGNVYKTGARGLADTLATSDIMEHEAATRTPEQLKTLTHKNPHKDKKTVKFVGADEIFNTFIKGRHNTQRIFDSYPAPLYVAARENSVAEAVSKLESGHSLFVSSWIGNGKSVFLDCLSCELVSKGWSVFSLKDFNEETFSDLNSLKNYDKLCVLIDNFDLASNSIAELKQHDHIRFVVSVRTGILELRYNQIYKNFPDKFTHIDINTLSKKDQDDLENILRNAGLISPNYRIDKLSMRDVVIGLFKNEVIKEKITNIVRTLESQHHAARKILLCCQLLRWYGLKSDISLIRSITNADPFSFLKAINDEGRDLFYIDGPEILVRSSVLSEYFLREYYEHSEITDQLIAMIRYANTSGDRETQRLFNATLMPFAKIRVLFEHLDENTAKTVICDNFYDRMRSERMGEFNPLFWLQYSFSLLEFKQYPLAEAFIETSYKAINGTNFDTYQIDTHALRVYLAAESVSTNDLVDRATKILNALSSVNSLIDNEDHTTQTIRALEYIRPFIENRRGHLRPHERSAFIRELSKSVSAINSIDESQRSRLKANLVASQIQNAIELLR